MTAALVVALLAACSAAPKPDAPAPPSASPTSPGKPTTVPGYAGQPVPVIPSKNIIKLPAPQTPKSWADARLQAAKRLVAANPDASYMSTPPDILLAIPVLSIELNGDGAIRRVTVMRYPSQARDTVDAAVAALKRAAPFGDVSRLPKPWKFNETFLFRDDRKFKPMTLDQR